MELPFSNDALICIRPRDLEFAVVGIDKRGYFCSFCEKGNRSCAHVRCLERNRHGTRVLMKGFLQLSNERTQNLPYPGVQFVTKFCRHKSIFSKAILNNTFDATNKDDLKLYPDVEKGNCLSCHADLLEETFWHNNKKNIFTLKSVFSVSGELPKLKLFRILKK